jgi:hypothetical protein
MLSVNLHNDYIYISNERDKSFTYSNIGENTSNPSNRLTIYPFPAAEKSGLKFARYNTEVHRRVLVEKLMFP